MNNIHPSEVFLYACAYLHSYCSTHQKHKRTLHEPMQWLVKVLLDLVLMQFLRELEERFFTNSK